MKKQLEDSRIKLNHIRSLRTRMKSVVFVVGPQPSLLYKANENKREIYEERLRLKSKVSTVVSVPNSVKPGLETNKKPKLRLNSVIGMVSLLNYKTAKVECDQDAIKFSKEKVSEMKSRQSMSSLLYNEQHPKDHHDPRWTFLSWSNIHELVQFQKLLRQHNLHRFRLQESSHRAISSYRYLTIVYLTGKRIQPWIQLSCSHFNLTDPGSYLDVGYSLDFSRRNVPGISLNAGGNRSYNNRNSY
ncbi:hypothetical protein DAPPUDRAFT_319684 [Daphnia pulex]|uniref:Uncharacterized protein n=1 Tax=Daphnia pulex TaxID=6669 RepID=E9GMH4_DAPPU|nr:hypothetical protein DAPPUDRAFT_319684 [Daphnia pulex]|eukprot:EFX79389.1 hypothetical protein DAPPUDRAFT_319684 [Daphnia pulex]